MRVQRLGRGEHLVVGVVQKVVLERRHLELAGLKCTHLETVV